MLSMTPGWPIALDVLMFFRYPVSEPTGNFLLAVFRLRIIVEVFLEGFEQSVIQAAFLVLVSHPRFSDWPVFLYESRFQLFSLGTSLWKMIEIFAEISAQS